VIRKEEEVTEDKDAGEEEEKAAMPVDLGLLMLW